MTKSDDRTTAVSRLLKGQMAVKKVSVSKLQARIATPICRATLGAKLADPGGMNLTLLWDICDALDISREDLRAVL